MKFKLKKILDFFKKKKAIYQFKSINKKIFPKKKKNINNIILIEFNAFQNVHYPLAHFANALGEKFNARIVAFFNYYGVVANLNEKLLVKLKWFIGNLFSLNFFGIYKSFGSTEIIKPRINLKNYLFIKKKVKLIIKNSKNKEDILKIKVKNIPIGDLIYDSYLKKNFEPTIDFKSIKFFEHLCDILLLYYYWLNYLKKNNVKSIVGVHNIYSYAIIFRIGIFYDIPVYSLNLSRIIKIDKKSFYENSSLFKFKKNFSKLPINLKKKALIFSEKKLQERIFGNKKVEDPIHSDNSALLHTGKYGVLIKNSKKIKILICPHDFFDAVHCCGPLLFSDFYEWLSFLGKFSKSNDKYEWYIKVHPKFFFWKKISINFEKSNNIFKKFLKDNNNIKLLPNNYSHLDIADQGIDFVLTCYGTVGLEYAYLGIPVINATKNNFHSDYKFNINPKNIYQYKNILNNLDKIKLKIDKNEVRELYFMRRFFFDTEWFIFNWNKFNEYIKTFDNHFSYKIYKYWVETFNLDEYKERMKIINNFIDSENKAINILNKSDLKQLDKKFSL